MQKHFLCLIPLLQLVTTNQLVADDETPPLVEVVPAGVDLVLGANHAEEASAKMEALLSQMFPGNRITGASEYLFGWAEAFGPDVVDYSGPVAFFAPHEIVSLAREQNIDAFETLSTLWRLLQSDHELVDRLIREVEQNEEPIPLLARLDNTGVVLLSSDSIAARTIVGVPVNLPDHQCATVLQAFGLDVTAVYHENQVCFAVDADSDPEDLLERPKLSSEFPADHVRRLSEADFLALLRLESGPGIANNPDLGTNWVTLTGTVECDEDADELVPLGARIGLSYLPDAAAQAEIDRQLDGIAEGVGPASLNGLPDGNVLVAFAACLGGHPFLSLDAKQLRAFAVPQVTEQMLNGVVAVSEHVEGGRIAIYRDFSSPSGSFSSVIILDTQHPEDLLAALRDAIGVVPAEEVERHDVAEQEGDDEAAADPREELTAESIRDLIRQLDADDVQSRTAAMDRLTAIGTVAIPFLEEAERSSSERSGRRIGACLVRIRRGQAAADVESSALLSLNLFQYLEPRFEYVIAGERRKDGTDVDWIRVTLSETPPIDEYTRIAANRMNAQQAAALNQRRAKMRLQSWFGPDWNRWRVAQTGNHVVILIGSQTELLDEALANLRDGNENTLSIARWQEGDGDHQVELYYDLNAITGFVSQELGILPADDVDLRDLMRPQLVNIGVGIEPDRVYVDVYAPISQLNYHFGTLINGISGLRVF